MTKPMQNLTQPMQVGQKTWEEHDCHASPDDGCQGCEILSSFKEKVLELCKDMKRGWRDMPGVDSSFRSMRAHGYNQALEEVTERIKQDFMGESNK